MDGSHMKMPEISVQSVILETLKDNASDKVIKFLQDIERISAMDYAEQETILRERLSEMSEDETAQLAHARLVTNLVKTALPVISHMDASKVESSNDFHLPSMIGRAKEKGYGARDMEEFLNTVRIWKSITPHPTEHLNKEGRDLYRELMLAADMPEEARQQHIEDITRKMLAADIAPKGKASMMEETQDAIDQSSIHRQGIRKLYRELKTSLEEHYAEDGPNAPDLLGPQVRMDMALRIWHAGDADGKPNADRWSMMSTMVLLAKQSVQEHLDDIQNAVNFELGLEGDNASKSLEDLFDRIETLEFSRQDRDRLRSNVKKLSTSFKSLENIEGQCLLPENERPDFESLKAEFSHLPIGQTQSREMCRDLNDLQSRFKNEEASMVLQESLFLLRMHGFSSAKIETRHNGNVYDEIMDNLYTNEDFLKRADISLSERHNINAAGGFSKLEDAKQRELMARAQKKMSAQEIQKSLFDANPDNRKKDDDFPPQTHEFLQRFRLVADHQNMFGMALIAEANDMSCEYQQFFADAIGIQKIINTPLPEEKETLESVSEAMIEYDKNGGQKNLQERMARAWFRKGLDNFHGLIIPCSDSTKQLGAFAKYQLREAITKVADWAFANGKTVLTKEGNGGAIGRGGGTGKTFYRYIMQAIKRNANEEGRYLNRKNSKDKAALDHASFMSNTEQGRFFRILSSVPTQVAGHLSNNIGEMLGVRMELEGLVPDGEFIAPYDDFSEELSNVVDTAHHEMLNYRGLRHVKNDDGSHMVDNYAQIISNSDVAGAANSGARPDSKDKKAKEFRKQRAIGSNIILDHERTMYDSSLFTGEFLERIYKDLHEGKLHGEDLEDFFESAFWNDHLQNNVMALAQSDITHGARRLGIESWSHKKMMTTAASIELNVHKNEDGETEAEMHFDDQGGSISKEQALHALIYADQFKSALLIEALLSLDTDHLPDLKNLYESEAPDPSLPLQKIELGQVTSDRWQIAETMREAANNQHLERVMSDLTQERKDRGEDISQEHIRLVSSAQRATTAAHSSIYLDQASAYGRSQTMKMKNDFVPRVEHDEKPQVSID